MEKIEKERVSVNIQSISDVKGKLTLPENVVFFDGFISSIEKVSDNLARVRAYTFDKEETLFVDFQFWNPGEANPDGFKFADYAVNHGEKKARIFGTFLCKERENENGKVFLNMTPYYFHGKSVTILPPSNSRRE